MSDASERRRLLRAALAALGSAALPVTAQPPELRVIELRHRTAGELLAALQPLLGPGETLTGMDSRLIVRASPATLAQLERAIAALDVARRNLRITVRHASAAGSREQSTAVRGAIGPDGTRVIVTGPPPGSGGLTVGRERPSSEVELHGERRIATRHAQLDQTLVVIEGGQGLIRIGESLPVVQPFLALVGARLRTVAGVAYHEVSTGFTVIPRWQGDTVLLSIAPRLSFRAGGGYETVELQELATTVSVRPGEWLDLGGAVETANDVNRQIFATRHHDRRESTRILVRVD